MSKVGSEEDVCDRMTVRQTRPCIQHTLTHQGAPSLLRTKAECTSNFHEKMYRLLDFIMSHDTADFQCKYLSFVQFEFRHSNKLITGTRKKGPVCGSGASVGLHFLLVKHTHTRTHTDWILNRCWCFVITNLVSFSHTICSFALNKNGNEFARALAENEMEKRIDEMKEGKDLGEITNVAYQKPLLLLPLVYRVRQRFFLAAVPLNGP